MGSINIHKIVRKIGHEYFHGQFFYRRWKKIARLQQRTTKPPDIQSIRKTQADKALKITKTIDEKAFIGILNDAYYYIIVRENDKTDEIVDLLKKTWNTD